MKAHKQVQKQSKIDGPKQDRRVGRSGRAAEPKATAMAANLSAADLSARNALQWQQAIGNRAVSQLISAGATGQASADGPDSLQRQTAGDEPVLRFGSRSEAVKMLQHYLVQAGADIAVDGIFGPITHRAVVAYQKENGLAVDGIVGPNTWTSLKVGGGTIDADKAGGAFGQANLFDQATAKLKAIAVSLRGLSDGESQGPVGPGFSLSELIGGVFSNAGMTEVVGGDQAITAQRLQAGEVIMAQPEPGGETVPGEGEAGGSSAEMAALLGAAADVNQAIVGLSVQAQGGLGPSVASLQTVVQQVGVDPGNTLNATTLSELDGVLADVQVFAANTAAGASKTGFTDIKIVKDDTYKFKADTIAEVGQELDNHMAIHGEAAHVSNTPSDNLITDQNTGKVVRAELTYSLTRELPEWTNAAEVGKKCPCWKKEWDRFNEAIKIHEQEHVNIYKKFLAGAHNKCIGLTESEARKAVQEVEDKVDKLQEDFDTKTKNGQTAPQSTKFNAGVSCDGCQNSP